MIRNPSDGSVRERCGCPACQKDGIQHMAACAVHNGPALHEGICTCAMGRGAPEDLDRLESTNLPASGLPTGSTKPENIAKLERSREWLLDYHAGKFKKETENG